MSGRVEVGFEDGDDAKRGEEEDSHDVAIQVGVGARIEDVFEGEDEDFDHCDDMSATMPSSNLVVLTVEGCDEYIATMEESEAI